MRERTERISDHLASICLVATVIGFAALALAWPQIRQRQLVSANTQQPGGDIETVTELTTSLPTVGVKGTPTAKIAFIEFSDFQCPFCGRYVRESSAAIEKQFVDSGKIVYVFRNLPLVNIHPSALRAAQAAVCAAQQDRFWPMHDRMFGDQKSLGATQLIGHANAIGLNVRQFSDCLGSTTDAVDADLAEARRVGVRSTPTFLIGAIQNDRTVKVLFKISGAQPLSVLGAALSDAIHKATARTVS